MKTHPFDRSTADGQKRMFYDAHATLAESNNAKMALMQYNAGHADGMDRGPMAHPNEPNYARGYRHATESLAH